MSLILARLYLGDMNDASNIKFLRGKGIKTIINCAEEVPNYFTSKFEYINLNFRDIPEQQITEKLNFVSPIIIKRIKEGKGVFVHCAAGISRSASVVIDTLMKMYGWNFSESFKFVKSLRNQINPNPGFVKQLKKEIYQEPQYFEDNEFQKNHEKPTGVNSWSKLTFDCEDCEKPEFTGVRTGGRKRYANLFV